MGVAKTKRKGMGESNLSRSDTRADDYVSRSTHHSKSSVSSKSSKISSRHSHSSRSLHSTSITSSTNKMALSLAKSKDFGAMVAQHLRDLASQKREEEDSHSPSDSEDALTGDIGEGLRKKSRKHSVSGSAVSTASKDRARKRRQRKIQGKAKKQKKHRRESSSETDFSESSTDSDSDTEYRGDMALQYGAEKSDRQASLERQVHVCTLAKDTWVKHFDSLHPWDKLALLTPRYTGIKGVDESRPKSMDAEVNLSGEKKRVDDLLLVAQKGLLGAMSAFAPLVNEMLVKNRISAHQKTAADGMRLLAYTSSVLNGERFKSVASAVSTPSGKLITMSVKAVDKEENITVHQAPDPVKGKSWDRAKMFGGQIPVLIKAADSSVKFGKSLGTVKEERKKKKFMHKPRFNANSSAGRGRGRGWTRSSKYHINRARQAGAEASHSRNQSLRQPRGSRVSQRGATSRSASEYFHAMFQSGLKESRSKVIEVVGTDAETLELLVKYMYSSDIGITVDNVQNILEACHQFQLTSLLKLCEAFMEQHVTADNSVGFYMFAERYSLNSLKEAARSNMADNFNEVVRTSVFCNLTIDGIVDLISDPALKSPPVNSVFEAACIWTRFEHKREALFHRLLEHMPLHLCTESYLTQTVATYPPMRRDDCQQYLQEALQKLKETALLIGGFYDGVSITDIQYLKVQDTGPSWQMLTNMPVKRKGLCAVIVDGGILVTGGFTWGMKDKPRRENAGCRMFDLTTKKWKKMPSLHDARFGHGSVVHGGCVYVGGGRTEDIPQLSTVEVYNQETRQWSRAPDMPKPASPIQMLSCNRYIYVVDRHKELLMLYNPVTRVWEERRDRPEGRNGCNAVILNDRLYVVGGNPSTCVRYDVDSDTWTVLTPPVGIEPWGAAIAYQGKIMLAAGGSTLVAEYTPELDSWSKPAAHMPKKLYTPCMLTIDSSSCK